MGISSAGEAVALAALLGSRFISLHSGDPGNTGASELSGGGYARVAGGDFTVTGGNPSTAANDGVVEFPTATGDWLEATHFGIWSASTGGTFIGGDALTTAKTITTDDVARFPAGALEIEAN
jgi:hypothetical protein